MGEPVLSHGWEGGLRPGRFRVRRISQLGARRVRAPGRLDGNTAPKNVSEPLVAQRLASSCTTRRELESDTTSAILAESRRLAQCPAFRPRHQGEPPSFNDQTK